MKTAIKAFKGNYRKWATIILILFLGGQLSAYSPRLKHFVTGHFDSSANKVANSIISLGFPDTRIINTRGSVENLKNLYNGKAEVGIVQMDVYTKQTYHDENMQKKVQLVMPIYLSRLHLLATEKIKSFSDLRYKNISLGEFQSGSYYSGMEVLLGLGYGSASISMHTLSDFDAIKSMIKGEEIDAALTMDEGVVDSVMKTDTQRKINLISLTDDDITKIKEHSNVYFPDTIHAGTYPWLKQDIRTVSVYSAIVVNSFTDEYEVDNFVTKILNNFDYLKTTQPILSSLDLKDVLYSSKIMADYMHPGALKAIKRFFNNGKNKKNNIVKPNNIIALGEKSQPMSLTCYKINGAGAMAEELCPAQ